jgi:hypothetical protein
MELKQKSGLTDDELKKLFGSETEDLFAPAITAAAGIVATEYGCASKTNCTSSDFADLQFGKSGVTSKIAKAYENKVPYLKTANSIADENWGSLMMYPYEVPAVT